MKSMSGSWKGLGARVEGRSVPKSRASGLTSAMARRVAAMSRSPRPKPVALT